MKPLFRTLIPAVLLASAAFADTTTTVAQEVPEPARDAFYLELLGNGLFYSMNYDRKFTDHVSGRVGITFIGATIAPIMANYLAGNGNHRFEVGIGPMLVSVPEGAEVEVDNEELEQELEDGGVFVLGTGTFGYRYQPVNGGFVFRIGLTPILAAGGGLPWAGMSFGYAF